MEEPKKEFDFIEAFREAWEWNESMAQVRRQRAEQARAESIRRLEYLTSLYEKKGHPPDPEAAL